MNILDLHNQDLQRQPKLPGTVEGFLRGMVFVVSPGDLVRVVGDEDDGLRQRGLDHLLGHIYDADVVPIDALRQLRHLVHHLKSNSCLKSLLRP